MVSSTFLCEKEVDMHRWWLVAVAPLLVVLAMGPPAGAAETKKPASGPAVFTMEEVPAFGKDVINGKPRVYYPNGAYSVCNAARPGELKAVPKFKSKRPLFGSITFDANSTAGTSGKTFYFALDESGERAPEASGKKAEKDQKAGKTGKVAGKKKPAPPADEEEEGMPEQGSVRYDRLYFDCNGDGDLTNAEVIRLSVKPPFEGVQGGMPGSYFDEVKVSLDFGSGLGKREVSLIPHALSYGRDTVLIQFLPKTARQGKIRLGNEEYTARLTQSRTLTGRYDRPMVQVELYPLDESKPARLQSGSLGQMRWIDGQYVSLSATPLGDKLTVEPYQGDLGVLEVGPGGRAVTELGIAGQIVSESGITVALGENWAANAMDRRYSVPVGDYKMPFFYAKQGRIMFAGRMSANLPPSEGRKAEPAFPIRIRKDKPFAVEFSGKPEVKFESPLKDKAFKPGQTVRIAAMLTEPWQNIQITGLWDVTKKDGNPLQNRLDPQIAIRDASGKTVTQGKMPFG
jgi:hypothetical protein